MVIKYHLSTSLPVISIRYRLVYSNWPCAWLHSCSRLKKFWLATFLQCRDARHLIKRARSETAAQTNKVRFFLYAAHTWSESVWRRRPDLADLSALSLRIKWGMAPPYRSEWRLRAPPDTRKTWIGREEYPDFPAAT
eukprot:sb/3474505/